MESKRFLASMAVAAAAVAAAPSASFAQLLYADNFDSNTIANYTVNADPDTTVTFNYDYSADGIPSAPGSIGGTTTGLKFTANNGDATAAAAAINVSPTGQNFTGDYTLRFYSWLNANGPFPAGGAGSTEFVTAGVENSGTDVQKSSGNANGPWFAGSGEGGATGDYRAYNGIALEPDGSAVYAAPAGTGRRESANTYYHTAIPGQQEPPASQQAAFPAVQTGETNPGTLGFAWHLHEISKIGDEVTWSINGLEIASFTTPLDGGNNVFVGHWDAFASISGTPEVNFGLIDNLEVVVVPEPATLSLLGLGALGLLARRRRA